MYINIDCRLFKLAREPTSLNYGEIVLLSLIKGMQSKGGFFMSNEAIAETLETSVRSVKRWLSNLNKLNLIETYYDEVSGKTKRIISAKIDTH